MENVLWSDFVVGIGASTTGLQALEAFFKHLPLDLPIAIVVAPQQSSDLHHGIVAMLRRQTRLPVCVVEDGMVLRLNTIYVMPPGHTAQLQGKKWQVDKPRDGSAAYPIDQLFFTLAKNVCDRSIGILPSGTESDGTAGLQAISRAGGIAVVQHQDTTQFRAIPKHPMESTNGVESMLSPEDLARNLFNIIRHSDLPTAYELQDEPPLSAEQLHRILELVQLQERVDFFQYKPATLHRRIIHRLLLFKLNTVEQYITYLKTTPTEVTYLYQDLLIGTTRFFRDPDMWASLTTQVLPALLNQLLPGQPLRVWVAACSTGEEVYSLAMAANEVIEQKGNNNPLKIFATDIDKSSLAIASKGLYPDTISQDVSPERLDQYFINEGSTYRIKKFIRAQVIFAPHDLTTNPGFSHMHLISCRNLLIYMQPPLQEQVIKLLHFSLAPQGVLILGPSETMGKGVSRGFLPIDQQWQIFRKRKDVKLSISRLVQFPITQVKDAPKPETVSQSSYENILSSVFKLRFGEHPTTCLLINKSNEILHVFINTARLLEFPVGRVNSNLLDNISSALKVPVSTALHRIKRDQQTVFYSAIQLPELGPNLGINLWIGLANGDELLPNSQFIILLEQVNTAALTTPIKEVNFDPNADLTQQIQELECELQRSRENLQTSIEELETANEEQQATNEELLASNEELQSTNEELQSTNEELYTVNTENQTRIQQLIELGTDVDNLLQSTDIGVIFLDQALNIRKFTLAATQVFNFRAGDIGRPVTELVNYLDIDDFMSLVQQVADTNIPLETEAINTKVGDHLLLRILPYRHEDDITCGIVITMIVINELKQLQDELIQSNTLLKDLYSHSPFGLCLLDDQLRVTRINPVLSAMNGLSIADHLGKPLFQVWPDLCSTIQPHCQQVLATAQPITNIEVHRPSSKVSPEATTLLFSYYPVTLTNDQQSVGIIVADITVQKQLQIQYQASQEASQQSKKQLQQLTQRLEESQEIAGLGDWDYEFSTNKITWSAQVFEITGFDPRAGVPSLGELFGIVHHDDRLLLTNLINLEQKPYSPTHASPIDIDIQIHPISQDLPTFINIKARLLRDAAEQPTKLYGTVLDITRHKNTQQELQQQAFFDTLTQLPNRAFFLEHLKLSMTRAERDISNQFAVLYLDLDEFKEVNDTLGHATGDQLLIEVAKRLDNTIRPGDIVSRLGGDEFAVLLEKTTQPQTAMEIAYRIQSKISEPCSLTSCQLSTSTSIGIAFYSPSDQQWPSQTAVLENADIAMYQAKRQGPGNIELFQPVMRTERADQVELKVGLHQALEQDEFVLHYQPLIHFPNQSLMGFEALVRWQHPQRGLLAPMEFLPIVQDSHLMPRLESWIFRHACHQLSQWEQNYNLDDDFYLNINVSPDFITSADFLQALGSILKESQVRPSRLCIELTEHSFIGRGSSVTKILQTIKGFGMRIALDDFGTGYSSLSYLHRLPIDVLKIDQSFIQSLGLETSLRGITKGIISLARQLELSITAEGIETFEQLRLVQEMGCDCGQGYLFSHAVPMEEAGQLIAASGHGE